MNKLTLVSKEINDECPDQLVTVEVYSCNEVANLCGFSSNYKFIIRSIYS